MGMSEVGVKDGPGAQDLFLSKGRVAMHMHPSLYHAQTHTLSIIIPCTYMPDALSVAITQLKGRELHVCVVKWMEVVRDKGSGNENSRGFKTTRHKRWISEVPKGLSSKSVEFQSRTDLILTGSPSPSPSD